MNCRIVCVAVCCLTIAAALAAADPPRSYTVKPTPPSAPASPEKKGAPAAPAEPTDFYVYEGRRIPLVRSATEVVIRLRAGESAGAVAGSLPQSATIGEEIRTEGRPFRVVATGSAAPGALPALTDQLRAADAVEMVAGVFRDANSGMRMLGTDEIVVKLRPGGKKSELVDRAAALGLRVDRPMWGTTDEFVLRLDDPKTDDAIRKAQLLHETGAFRWVEPNFIREYTKFATPNDPRFNNQWHLNNTGQGGGVPTADVDAVAAWNVQTGSSTIIVAVVDDGVQKAHEDLAANIFTNPGEVAGNGLDDDHNGYVDDVNGWDFSNNDNNADPFDVIDAHGTAVAGVSAARGNNAIGVSGACQTCKILPVKIFSPDYAGDVATANALRYAASFADIVNNSWGGGAPSATLQSAIQTGSTNGRGGRGSAMMFATGNSASGNFWISAPALPAGTHRFRWTYLKDISLIGGEDAVWVSWAAFPGSAVENFAGGLPSGWTTGGDSSWSVVTDPRHSDEGVCYTKAVKSGALDHEESNWVQAVKTISAGNFLSYQWVSSEYGYDGLIFEIDLNNNGSIDLWTDFISGAPFIDTGVSYPAAYPESIAVGASSNFDCRSHYSQYGSQVAFVAPSSAGPLNLRIESTDRTGASGYDAGNYTQAFTSSGFGGTSSATPLASGVAGLLLSRNANLTQAQVKSTLQNGADKVGPEPYVSGRNDRYGHGRINALQSLQLISPCGPVTLAPAVVPNGYTSTPYNLSFVAAGGAPGYTYAVTVGSAPPGLSLSAAGVLSGTPSTPGTYSFSVRATDTGGCTAYRAINMVVTAPPPVAGTRLYIVTPCRVVDSRNANGPSGGPALANGATRDLQFAGVCGVPHTAVAVVANITAINPATTGFMALYPTGSVWPGTTTISTRLGKTRANNAIIRLANTGQATIRNSGLTQHFIVDVTGYFQ